jgi:hypothetical protein
MYKDVQNSNNVDKQMLNQLVNENVTQSNERIKKVTSSGLFFTCLLISKTSKKKAARSDLLNSFI